MPSGEKILITGATGKIAFPIARELAKDNEVWGAARLGKPGDRERLIAAGITPLKFDMANDDVADLPKDFTYVFHAAVDPGGIAGEWGKFVRTNAHNSGNLFYHTSPGKGFVYCSTGSTRAYQGQRPLTESDPPGLPHAAVNNYSFAKVAGESVCSWISEQFDLPLTIIRIFSSYGPQGGSVVDRLEAMLRGDPIRVHTEKPNNYAPIYEDDYVRLSIRALEAASVPPLLVNWGGSETVSIEDYCAYMGELIGIEPKFEYTSEAHTPMWPDTTLMHEVLGRCEVSWRDGMRRTIKALHPELKLKDEA